MNGVVMYYFQRGSKAPLRKPVDWMPQVREEEYLRRIWWLIFVMLAVMWVLCHTVVIKQG